MIGSTPSLRTPSRRGRPGVSLCPLPASAEREPVRARVFGLLRAMLDAPGCPGRLAEGGQSGRKTLYRVLVAATDPEAICGQIERALKTTAFALDAGLIGGSNVTRLDRMIRSPHPRIAYSEALGLLAGRGFALRPGEAVNDAAAACLVYQYGNLPVQVTGLSGGGVLYLLPHVGETFSAGGSRPASPGDGAAGPAGEADPLGSASPGRGSAELRIHLDRLVDYFLGRRPAVSTL
jgi:hypothetical protein